MARLDPTGVSRILSYIKNWVTTALGGKANSSHNHTKSQITDFPTIPSNTSQLTNDSGYITSSGSCNYANSAGSAGSATTAETVRTSVAADSSKALVYSSMADNDFCRILVGGSSNAGYVEIATADDGNEPIYVRQYTGVFSTVTRTLTLLDGSGNTQFPGTVSAPTFSGNLNGNCDYANSAGYVQGNNNSANAANALLRSGSGRTDSSPEGDTWIFLDSIGGSDAPWGFKHNQWANTIGFYGAGTETSSINLSNGYFSGSCNYANSAGSANDPNAVHKSGDETIDGVKTYSSDIYSVSSQHLRFRHLDGSNNGGMDGCLFLNYDNNAKNVYFNGASYYINGGYYNGRAENAQYTYWLRTSSHADHLFHTEWDGSYFWTYVTAGDGGYRPVRVERSNSAAYADGAGSVTCNVPAESFWAPLSGTMAANDGYRIRAGGTNNGGELWIETSDDGNEPIGFAQWAGDFTSVTRSGYLLNGSGNTEFPGTLFTYNGAVIRRNGIPTPGWGMDANTQSVLQIRTEDNTEPSLCFHRSGHSHVVLGEQNGELITHQQGGTPSRINHDGWTTLNGYRIYVG